MVSEHNQTHRLSSPCFQGTFLCFKTLSQLLIIKCSAKTNNTVSLFRTFGVTFSANLNTHYWFDKKLFLLDNYLIKIQKNCLRCRKTFGLVNLNLNVFAVPIFTKKKFKKKRTSVLINIILQKRRNSLSVNHPEEICVIFVRFQENSPRKNSHPENSHSSKSPLESFPRKIPTQKIPTWNISTHFINCLSSLFLHLIFRGPRMYMYILPLEKKQQ